MELHGYQDPIRCRAFTITLKGPALAWFNKLPPSSISSFTELSIAFVSHFIGARTYRKPSYHLLTIKQSSRESLRLYVQRFNAESLKVDIPDEKFAITAFIARLGVQSKDLMFSISKNPQASMAKVLAKTDSISMVKKPSYPSKEALLLKRKRARATKNGNEAQGGMQTRTDPQEGAKKTESGPRKYNGPSEIAWDHLILSCSSGIHLENTPP